MFKSLIRPIMSMILVGVATGVVLRSGETLLIVPGVFLASGAIAASMASRDRWHRSFATNAAAGVFATVLVIAVGVSQIEPSNLDSERWVIGTFWMFAGAIWASLGVGIIGPFGWVLFTRWRSR